LRLRAHLAVGVDVQLGLRLLDELRIMRLRLAAGLGLALGRLGLILGGSARGSRRAFRRPRRGRIAAGGRAAAGGNAAARGRRRAAGRAALRVGARLLFLGARLLFLAHRRALGRRALRAALRLLLVVARYSTE